MSKAWLAVAGGAAIIGLIVLLMMPRGDPSAPAPTPPPAPAQSGSKGEPRKPLSAPEPPLVRELPAVVPPSWQTGERPAAIRPPPGGEPVPPSTMRPVNPADAVVNAEVIFPTLGGVKFPTF